MKIAVCDDDLIFQRKIKEELDQYYQSLDVLVEIFSSGEDLLRAAAADPYGFFCVFLDIEMPGIDGMETARRLGELNRNLPVLFLTSHRDLAVEGYELNAFRFLTKPLEHERLCRSLAALEAKGREQARISVTKDGRDLFLPVRQFQYKKNGSHINLYFIITMNPDKISGKLIPEILLSLRIHDNIRKTFQYLL